MKAIIFFIFSLTVFSKPIPIKCTYLLSEKTTAVANYENANYRLTVENKKIKVEIAYKPLKIKTRYPFQFTDEKLKAIIRQNLKNSESLLPLAEKLKKNQTDYYSLIDKILDFITEKFKYRTTRQSPFIGDCNTAADTSVKLLALCGIPARIKYAVIMEKNKKTLSGRSLHAIIEIYYPGSGWILSDPIRYHHFVPANYILVNKSEKLLGITIEKKNCLNKKPFVDILKRKTMIYKLPNLFRYY